MAAKAGGSSIVQPNHPPCPKSPPKYPDLYGTRREKAKLQMMEREISFLEDEIKSVEGFQPASRYCKEVTDFVMANADPLAPPKNKQSCGFWKWLLCGLPFCYCYTLGCSFYLKCPKCCKRNPCNWSSCNCSLCKCGSCFSWCRVPKWRCCSCPKLKKRGKRLGGRTCCGFRVPSCTSCCSGRWKCSCPTCFKVSNCCSCRNPCCSQT